ncbi:MAG: hypothetical protein V7K53_04480 [Nostoc sp.]|uniref:dual OB domain-containing protein n=1 Tax=Nostoc sp. TaxID=1180 RepID=UPI002FFA0984
MPSLKKIVCLANSKKNGERCIAGIDLDTGNWIRPVCVRDGYSDDGRVPRDVRLVERREPELLDILEIPLADEGNNFDFESENLTILSGEWRLLGKAKPTDVFQYCGNYPYILHNRKKYVNVSELQSLPFRQRRTLQLLHVVNLSVQSQGIKQWKGSLETASGQKLTDAKITDPIFIEKLETGYQITNDYLVTVSLGMPWAHDNWEGEPPCWKLIAGVIDFPKFASQQSDLIAQTDKEIERIGWDIDQGRKYLQQSFNKISRQQLSLEELTQFLNYLKSIPDDFDNLPS